jgi:uncharacterized linocin/CFP29 family protein
VTDHLRRDLAPVTSKAWSVIEAEAVRTLRHFLAARPLVDVRGPLGWEHASRTTGRVEPVGAVAQGVEGWHRIVQPLVELRRPFTLPLDELDTIARGAADPDLSAVTEAARQAALAEDIALFVGWPAAGIRGIAEASPHDPIPISEDYSEYPGHVARAVAALRQVAVGGPYALALGPRCYTGVIETTTHGGYPVLEQIRLILGGPIVWAPGVDGAAVISQRGGDHVLTLGQDWSIGYRAHTADEVELYLEESFDFEVREPTAAITLRYQ